MGWWLPLLATEASILLPAAHTALASGATGWEMATLQHQVHSRENCHIGCLSHLLCQERIALAKLRVSWWIGKRGQDLSLPCQDLHIYTSTGKECSGLSPDSRHWDHPLTGYSFASCSAVFGKKSVCPHPTSSSLLSFSAQKHLPQEQTGTMTSQTRQLHLQNLSDLSSAIKTWFVCSVPASKLTSVTMPTEKAWGKRFNFPLSHAFWQTTGQNRSCSGKHMWPWLTSVTWLLPPGQPPLGISCLQRWVSFFKLPSTCNFFIFTLKKCCSL